MKKIQVNKRKNIIFKEENNPVVIYRINKRLSLKCDEYGYSLISNDGKDYHLTSEKKYYLKLYFINSKKRCDHYFGIAKGKWINPAMVEFENEMKEKGAPTIS